MVSCNDCFRMIEELIPDLDVSQKDLTEDGCSIENLCTTFNALTDHVCKHIKNDENDKLKDIFALVEEFATNGDKNVKESVVTCFLENLLNLSSQKYFEVGKFSVYLGPQSEKYCLEINDFWKKNI